MRGESLCLMYFYLWSFLSCYSFVCFFSLVSPPLFGPLHPCPLLPPPPLPSHLTSCFPPLLVPLLSSLPVTPPSSPPFPLLRLLIPLPLFLSPSSLPLCDTTYYQGHYWSEPGPGSSSNNTWLSILGEPMKLTSNSKNQKKRRLIQCGHIGKKDRDPMTPPSPSSRSWHEGKV